MTNVEHSGGAEPRNVRDKRSNPLSFSGMQVQQKIETRLRDAFSPVYLTVENESHMHNVPPGSESHFKVTLVSEAFEGERPVRRHQAVYGVLSEEMAGPVHALALHTYTPEEWQGRSPDSPQCLGGARSAN